MAAIELRQAGHRRAGWPRAGALKATAKVAEFLFRKPDEGPQCGQRGYFLAKDAGKVEADEPQRDHRQGLRAIKSETRFPQTKSVDDTVARFSKARSAPATDRYLLTPAPSWNSAGSLVRTESSSGLPAPSDPAATCRDLSICLYARPYPTHGPLHRGNTYRSYIDPNVRGVGSRFSLVRLLELRRLLRAAGGVAGAVGMGAGACELAAVDD